MHVDPRCSPAPSEADARELISSIARSNVQLYNQLQAQDRPSAELQQVRSAYDLAARLYSGAYQADGKPFLLHLVSVASTLALLHLSSEVVAAALIHNVYNNGDFGDGHRRRCDGRRRQIVRDAVGDRVEALVYRFAELRLQRRLDELLRTASDLSQDDHDLVTMDLADVLEKHLDCGVLYFGDNDWVLRFSSARLPELEALARAVDQPLLGEALRIAVGEATATTIDPVLRSPAQHRYLRFVFPLSSRRKFAVALRQAPALRRLAAALMSARRVG